MKAENSGKIFRLPLEFNFGYAYAEMDDFSDSYPFDGILITVFKLIDSTIVDRSIEDIRQSGISLGPVPIYRYPPLRGKGAWKVINKTSDFLINEWPMFKYLQGVDNKKDWSTLPGWYKVNRGDKSLFEETPYEELRHLETTTLNSAEGVAIKITMMKIIKNGESISQYYDLTQLRESTLYIQLVNTYYDKETATKLLEIVNDLPSIG
ncbi:MAG: hypothetical protein ACO1PI_00615 [Bacteroidota bacterium]